MDVLKGLREKSGVLGNYLLENKWSVLAILIGIFLAYQIGAQVASNIREDFENRCEKEKRLYEDNKPPVEECEKPKKKKKKTIASASCPEVPDMSQYVLKDDVPDLKDYIHKSLIPDMTQYISRNYVRKNYIRKDKCRKIIDDEDSDDDNCQKSEPKRPVIVCNQDLDPLPEKKDKGCETKDYKKIQEFYDKNAENMDVTYSRIEDAFTNCNKGTCLINQLPNGLKPLDK